MTDYPLVSILINNHNYEQFLPEAIDSALNQTYPHTEVIVVDDGSTDKSREIIARYGNKIIPVFKPNGGQVSAFNTGFATSRGDIICFLDSDDLFFPEKVAAVVEAFDSSQDLGWCFHPLKFVDIQLTEIQGNSSIPQRLHNALVTEYDVRGNIQRGRLSQKFPSPSTSGISLKRSLLELILPIPEKDQSTLLNEAFLIFSSLGLSRGVVLHLDLGFYRIHGSNANAMTQDKQRLAKICILHAYWLREKFPSFANFTHCLMGLGIGVYQANGGVKKEYQELVQRYLSSVTLREKLEIYARAKFQYFKNKLIQLRF
ncbi:MAG TPA: glucosyl transferase [Cyanobacteria bacterium UBA11149]|nr:glucosyl transferase [Cyanobacteria bacterium UBA11367]HBE60939.1 glucosyl transferase [Cyanobacteria bacterium UBA11366]HBK62441.1 glucosyl transferase [Cyanobacteria bacterium UBA11166]HBR76401.1 glucosyl transferase [Cyanobacteria bacterium UBA11159]HBS72056.1 glucosyl transferase [Cyanobacteria bacterium UBA11153]HBW89751.1 glucosyl transferase [Cyanobacteria bacterium UBA11149]HCA95469.1 glucosyl transferase [Cyanobacteria bacterium UBA9226]